MKRFAMEDDTVVATPEMTETELAELDSQIVDRSEETSLLAEIDDTQEQISDGAIVADQLRKIEEITARNENPTESDVRMTEVAVEALLNSIGGRMPKSRVATEDYSGRLKYAQESMGEAAKKIWEKIKAFFVKMKELLMKLLGFSKEKDKKYKEKINELRKAIEKDMPSMDGVVLSSDFSHLLTDSKGGIHSTEEFSEALKKSITGLYFLGDQLVKYAGSSSGNLRYLGQTANDEEAKKLSDELEKKLEGNRQSFISAIGAFVNGDNLNLFGSKLTIDSAKFKLESISATSGTDKKTLALNKEQALRVINYLSELDDGTTLISKLLKEIEESFKECSEAINNSSNSTAQSKYRDTQLFLKEQEYYLSASKQVVLFRSKVTFETIRFVAASYAAVKAAAK